MKLFILKKKSLVIVSIVLAIILCMFASVFVITNASAKEKKTPIYCVKTEKKQVAITFDACWGAEKTLDILAVLEHYDVKADFFVVQSWAEKYSDKLSTLAKSGRIEVGTHSKSHPHMASLTKKQIGEELDLSVKAIEKIIGKAPTLFRPPYGEYNDTLISECESRSLQAIQWDVDSLDWKGLSASQMSARVLKGAKEGSIILMHNDGEHTVEALPLIILGLKSKGYEFVFVSELLYKDNYIIDSSGKQVPTK